MRGFGAEDQDGGGPALKLAGRRTRAQTCDEIARTLKQRGLEEFAAEFIVGAGFRSGSASSIAKEANPCRGARGPLARTHDFDGSGRFSSFNEKAEQVDDAAHAAPDAETLVVNPGEPGAVTIHYKSDGAIIRFTVVNPDPCSSRDCREQIAWALETFEMGSWRRAD